MHHSDIGVLAKWHNLKRVLPPPTPKTVKKYVSVTLSLLLIEIASNNIVACGLFSYKQSEWPYKPV